MNKLNVSAGNILLCTAEIIIGILLLINPVGFTSLIITMLGIVLSVMGISDIVGYFREEPEKASKEKGLSMGLLLATAGIFCIFKSEWFIATFPIFTVFYGIITLVIGFGKIQWAVDMLRKKEKYWFIEVIGAALTVVFSVLIIANPFASSGILWTFIAVSLIVEALVDIVAIIFERKKN